MRRLADLFRCNFINQTSYLEHEQEEIETFFNTSLLLIHTICLNTTEKRGSKGVKLTAPKIDFRLVAQKFKINSILTAGELGRLQEVQEAVALVPVSISVLSSHDVQCVQFTILLVILSRWCNRGIPTE